MDKKIKIIFFLIIGLIIIIFGRLILIGGQVPVNDQGQETEDGTSNLQEEYPNNILEGVVKAVDMENKTFVLEVKAGLIKTSEQDKMDKSIKVTESTIYEIYYISTGETDGYEFSEIAVDDNIVVFTMESTYDEINSLEEFTAKKISKRAD